MKLTAKDLARIRHVEFRNPELLKGKKISGVSTDSRTAEAGDLFFALKGGTFDGHAFVGEAFGKGAVAAVVEASVGIPSPGNVPVLIVENTTVALAELARHYRLKFSIPVLAVGGSNGKTTTKEMIARVLSTEYNVLSTEGNLNNHIGVPHTLFRLQKNHEIAVVEIGTNHPGEIGYLSELLEPTHGVITNIGREHLEFFHSLDGVADEEGALFERLRRTKKGTAFVSADDERVVEKSRGIKNRITFGLKTKRVDVRGRVLGLNESGCARVSVGNKKMKKAIEIQLAIPGEHNAENALAAAAVGLAFKVRPKHIRKALETFHPASKRMEVLNLGGVIVFNDTYNANPDSTIAALRTLAAATVSGKRIAVLADMRELGELAVTEHERVGAEVALLGIEYLLTYGELARKIHEAAGLPLGIHYEQKNILAEYLAELIAPGDAVLVKGSRGMKMEDVVTFLEERLRSAVVPFG